MAFLKTKDSSPSWLTGNHRFLLPATLMILILSVSACGTKSSETTEAQSKNVTCITGLASRQMVPQTVSATGGLEADKSIMISTRMMGWIRKIHVVENQVVAKGDRLINIDDSDLRAKKIQAEAGITEAEAVLKNAEGMAARFVKLYEEKSVSRQQLDDVLTGRDRAAAGMAMARANLVEINVHLSYLDIVAPSDGVIARKFVEEGSMANPGMPLLSLESTGRMKVVAHLGEKDISLVKQGDEVEINVTSLANARFTATLDRVIQSANPGSRTYDIETYLDNSDGRLKSGMFARVTVPVGTRPAILVPTEAIFKRGQLTGVWIVESNGTVRLRWIRPGHELGNQTEILSGMAGTETVVLSSEAPLAEGDKAVK